MDCTQSVHPRQALPPLRLSTAVDVTVIGAGPAGALLAYLLVRRGLRVVLVEKARLPRVKPCGGGLNWKTVRLLPFAIDAVVERIVSRVVFTQRCRHPFARTSPQHRTTLGWTWRLRPAPPVPGHLIPSILIGAPIRRRMPGLFRKPPTGPLV